MMVWEKVVGCKVVVEKATCLQAPFHLKTDLPLSIPKLLKMPPPPPTSPSFPTVPAQPSPSPSSSTSQHQRIAVCGHPIFDLLSVSRNQSTADRLYLESHVLLRSNRRFCQLPSPPYATRCNPEELIRRRVKQSKLAVRVCAGYFKQVESYPSRESKSSRAANVGLSRAVSRELSRGLSREPSQAKLSREPQPRVELS
uniref:Uncharacterized protein n=1 Tax=Cucumis melo TaxID=3656 RepID=A0A9I9EGA7_CUCME